MLEATVESLRGGGGSLFTRSWRQAPSPSAVLAICHGFNSHSAYYEWVGQKGAEAGLVVYAVDLRGRGKSDGERFYIENFDDYVADLHVLVSQAKVRHPGLPLFVLGHSAGGVIATLYALEHGGNLAGLICEDIAFEVPAPDIALAALKGISHVAPHTHSLTLRNKDFSRDPKVLNAMNKDPLIAGESQPFATAAAIVRADERLKRSFRKINIPLLLIHGAQDKVAKPSGSQHFHERAGSKDKTLKVYEGRFHDPLNDLGKEQVMADMLKWIGARVAQP